jgi:hypothetical protein
MIATGDRITVAVITVITVINFNLFKPGKPKRKFGLLYVWLCLAKKLAKVFDNG